MWTQLLQHQNSVVVLCCSLRCYSAFRFTAKTRKCLGLQLMKLKPICARTIGLDIENVSDKSVPFFIQSVLRPFHVYRITKSKEVSNSFHCPSGSNSRTLLQSSTTSRIIYRHLSDDSYKKSMLISKIDNVLGFSNSPGDPLVVLDSKRFSSDEEHTKISLEKKIIHLMDIWDVDAAIDLLKEAVVKGADPDRTVILDMLWQIAELGKVECLLHLYETFLKEHGLVNGERFYKCLGLAIFSSGRVEEGMDILMKGYETDMSFGDIDVLFTVLATKIIKEYDDHIHLVETFVDTVQTGDPPVLHARAMLWKCLVMAGSFDKADELRTRHVELKKLIPAQVTSIIQSSPPSSRIEFDREAVLQWLVQQLYLKEGLKASALHLLVQIKSDENEWSQVIKYLTMASDHNVTPLRETMVNFLARFFDECSDEDENTFWKSVGKHMPADELKLLIENETKGNK